MMFNDGLTIPNMSQVLERIAVETGKPARRTDYEREQGAVPNASITNKVQQEWLQWVIVNDC